jgi:hypothetical protein
VIAGTVLAGSAHESVSPSGCLKIDVAKTIVTRREGDADILAGGSLFERKPCNATSTSVESVGKRQRKSAGNRTFAT